MSARRALAVALLLMGCGGGARGEYARFFAEGERAYSAGRYDEAGAAFRNASEHTARASDRDEARYRAAASQVRGGRLDEAQKALEELVLASPKGTRAARASLDRADILLGKGDHARGMEALDGVVRTYPDSGAAEPALRRYLSLLAEEGEPRVRAYLDARLSALSLTELGEALHAAYAASLERSGDLPGARARYLLVAERYPYPRGRLWDDALFHAADLAARLGAPREAIETLERMLRERERAYLQGSYERGRYADAQFRIGELYRDALDDPASARVAFERLWSSHPSSRLRDDAAWSAASLAVRAGDLAGACRDLRALLAEQPTSRYAACAPSLCPELSPPSAGARCHDYILRGEPPARTPEISAGRP